MRRTLGHSGNGGSLKGVTAVLVGSIWLVMATAFPEVTPPSINCPWKPFVKASLGKKLVIPCLAEPGYPNDFTLIYWLANKQFVNTMYPNARVKEDDERKEAYKQKVFIQRDLIFQTVKQKDFRSNYTCVVASPTGINKITVQLKKKIEKFQKGERNGKRDDKQECRIVKKQAERRLQHQTS